MFLSWPDFAVDPADPPAFSRSPPALVVCNATRSDFELLRWIMGGDQVTLSCSCKLGARKGHYSRGGSR